MTAENARELNSLHSKEMGLGAWAWGDRIFWNYGRGYTDNDIAEAFSATLSSGVDLVDTAEIYGSGRSEYLLGQFIQQTDRRVYVATKFFPIPTRWRAESIVRALRRSLSRLNLERVDLYQLHWPSPVVPIENYVEGLALAHQAGLTGSVGVSNYDKHQMQRAMTVLAKYNIPLAANQVEYHLLDRRIEKNGLLARCKETNVRLIAYSPLAKGMLTGKYKPGNPPPGPRGRQYSPLLGEIETLVGFLKELGTAHGGKTPGQVALNWVICKGALPIPGAKNLKQAEENLGALGWHLTSDEVAALDQASDRFTK
jgi:aryl-alcohol dehydrogenase-like predicted oxidoreductase